MTMPNNDAITLSACRLDCIIGLLPQERHAPQPLDVELTLGLDLEPASGGDIAQSIDYAEVLGEMSFIAGYGHFRLLESLATAVASHFLSPPSPKQGRACLQTIQINLQKPMILDGKATPGITVKRDRTWFQSTRLGQENDRILLFEGDGVRLWRQEVASATVVKAMARTYLCPIWGTTLTGPVCMDEALSIDSEGAVLLLQRMT